MDRSSLLLVVIPVRSSRLRAAAAPTAPETRYATGRWRSARRSMTRPASKAV